MYPISLTSMPHHSGSGVPGSTAAAAVSGPGSSVSKSALLLPSHISSISESELNSSFSSCSTLPLMSGQSSPIHSRRHPLNSNSFPLLATSKQNVSSGSTYRHHSSGHSLTSSSYCLTSSSLSSSVSASASSTSLSLSSNAAIASIEILLEPIRYSMTFLTLFSILSTIIVAILLAPFGRLQLLAQFVSLLVSLSGLFGITRRSILLSSVYALSMLLFLFLQCSYFFVLLKLVQEVNLSSSSNNNNHHPHHQSSSTSSHHGKTTETGGPSIIYLDDLPPGAVSSAGQLPASVHHLESQSPTNNNAATSAIITTITSPSSNGFPVVDPALSSNTNITKATSVADTSSALLLLATDAYSNPAYLPSPSPDLETNQNHYHPQNQPSIPRSPSHSEDTSAPDESQYLDANIKSPSSQLLSSSSFTHVRHISIVLHEELTYLSLLTVPMLAWLPPSLFMETAAVLLLSMQALAAACFLYVLRIHAAIVVPAIHKRRRLSDISSNTLATTIGSNRSRSSSRGSSIPCAESESESLIISASSSQSPSSSSSSLQLPPPGATINNSSHRSFGQMVNGNKYSEQNSHNHQIDLNVEEEEEEEELDDEDEDEDIDYDYIEDEVEEVDYSVGTYQYPCQFQFQYPHLHHLYSNYYHQPNLPQHHPHSLQQQYPHQYPNLPYQNVDYHSTHYIHPHNHNHHNHYLSST